MSTKIWRTSGGDISRRGLAAIGFVSNPKLLLQLHGNGGLSSSPVFSESGAIFFADMAGGIHSYTPKGEKRWSKEIQGGVQSSPVLNEEDSRLFAATFTGHLYAFDANGGEIIWNVEIPSEADSRILSDLLYLPKENLIILSSWGYKYYAVDAKTGALKNTWDAGSTLYSGASAMDDNSAVLLRVKSSKKKEEQAIELLRLHPSQNNTDILFSISPGQKPVNFLKIAAAPVVSLDNKTIYFSANIDANSHIYAYSVEKKQLVWEKTLERHLLTTPALRADGVLVLSDLTGAVKFLSPEKGDFAGSYSTGTYYLLSSPVCDNENNAFVGDIEGKIHAIAPDGKGKVIYDTGRCIQARPAFDPSGRLFVPSMSGTLCGLG